MRRYYGLFGKRADGRKIKNLKPFYRIIPYIMKTRTDSQNFFNEEFMCDSIDEYIATMRERGIDNITYMSIIIATMVRTIALRPQLNRFVKNGKIYARPKIWVSFALQKDLREGSDETTVKLEFEGTENIFEISEAVSKIIEENAKTSASTDTDKLANLIMSIPGFLIRFVVNTLIFMDNHEMIPKSVIKASPFHTSFFITNLKSLGINYIYHHVYEFGTTGIFIAMGKERFRAVASKDGDPDIKKVLTLAFVLDERFCDGLYFARSMRIFKKCLTNPKILEERLSHKIEDVD